MKRGWLAPIPGRHTLGYWVGDGSRKGPNGTFFCAAPDGETIVARWRANGWPVMLRRPVPGEPLPPGMEEANDAKGWLPVGVALPPDEGKRRVALWVRRGAIARWEPPCRLAQAMASAPAGWQPWLAEVVAAFETRGLEVWVYGALLWQYLTGLAYLHAATSDLDLLCTPQVGQRATALAAFARAAAAEEARPVDGELFITSLGWAAWRECLQTTGRTILLKHDHGVSLVERAACA